MVSGERKARGATGQREGPAALPSAHSTPQMKFRVEINSRADNVGWEQKKRLVDDIYNDNQWELTYFLLEKLIQIDRIGCHTAQNGDKGKAET